ncbi:MAG: ABC transporter permease [Lautropia sp.]|nr:ABC transporter permease [Lautropia sp.]
MSAIRLSWRFLCRDLRAGELHLLLTALVVAVAAIVTVGFFVERLNHALDEQASQLLGGDLVLNADRPVPPEWMAEAEAQGLQTAYSIGFPSMAVADTAEAGGADPDRVGVARSQDAADGAADDGKVPEKLSSAHAPAVRAEGLEQAAGASEDGTPAREDELPATQLASVLAVSADHPLRGSLRVTPAALAAPADDTADAATSATLAQSVVMPSPAELLASSESLQQGPAPGTVWIDQALAQALGAQPGQYLRLGDIRLRISRLILIEPGRAASFINFAPRLMMSLQDLPRAGLIGPGSRLNYRFLVAGPREQVAGFQRWLEARLERGQRIETLESGRPEMQTTLVRARQFLALVSLLSALIAAVAIGLAARRFAERHLDGFAVLKVMGISQSLLSRALWFEMLWLALAGGALAVLIGWGAHHALAGLARGLLPHLSLPPAGMMPAFQALVVAVVLVLGFAAVPVLRLSNVAPLRVLRRELGAPRLSVWLLAGSALLAFGLLMFWLVDEPRLAAWALMGFVVAGLCFVMAAAAVVRLSAALRPRLGHGQLGLTLRLALTAWSRRRMVTVTQVVALAIGLMAMLLLTVVRHDLLASWQQALPADAPNRFVINIQPEQQDTFLSILARHGLRGIELHPVVRGRLVAINDRPVGAADFKDDRARRLVDRAFNLSYASHLPAHNTVEVGRWLKPGAAEVSAETGIMKTLGLSVGDRLRFDVAGQPVDVTLVGGRRLRWDSMRVNFFMITSPEALADQPQSLITSFHLPSEKTPVVRRLLAAMPNLSVIDTGVIAAQVQAVIAQVVQAVQFLFLFTLAAGLIVLHAAMSSVQDERVAEVALMRALGASRGRLMWAQLAEMSLTGLLAAFMATLGATGIGWLLASQVFRFDYQPDGWLLLVSMLGGALFIVLASSWRLWRLLDAPPLRALRSA